MPTSSGFDRTNYGTTLNFSRYGGPGGPGGPNAHQYQHFQNQPSRTSNNNSSRTTNQNTSFNSNIELNNQNSNQNGNHNNHKQARFFSPVRNSNSYRQYYKAVKTIKAASVGSSPNIPTIESNENVMHSDPFSVNIRDPNLRELVQKLVKLNDATKKRESRKDEGTTISKIDHNGYQILFSRNPKFPIEEMLQRNRMHQVTPKETRAIQTDINFRQLREAEPNGSEEFEEAQHVQVIPVQQQHSPSQFVYENSFQDQAGNRYVFAPANTPGPNSARSQYESTKTMILNEAESTGVSNIQPEVHKIIEQDLAKNPIPTDSERMYRIVINSTSPNEDAQVVRVLVKSEGTRAATATVMAAGNTVVAHQPATAILTHHRPSAILVQSPPSTVHYHLPSVEPNTPPQHQQPHRYTPPPHKSIILPSSAATAPAVHYEDEAEAEAETKKKPKKRFSFFS